MQSKPKAHTQYCPSRDNPTLLCGCPYIEDQIIDAMPEDNPLEGIPPGALMSQAQFQAALDDIGDRLGDGGEVQFDNHPHGDGRCPPRIGVFEAG